MPFNWPGENDPGVPLGAATPQTLVSEDAREGCSALVEATVALWHGARERGETGVEAADGWAAFAVWEVPAVPDFSSPRFPDLAALDEAHRVARVGQLQAQAVAALYPLGDRCALSLRFRLDPDGGGGRVRLFLIGRCFAPAAREASGGLASLRRAFEQGFPREYPLVFHGPGGAARAALSAEGVGALAEVVKPEQVFPAWHDPALCGFPFLYAPLPFAAAENDMTALCDALLRAPGGGAVWLDVTLQPALPLTATERAEASSWAALCERWGREQRLQIPGGLYSKPRTLDVAADPNAQEARKLYQDALARYGTAQARPFLYAVRVLSQDPGAAPAVAQALAARALSPGAGHQLFVLTPDHPAFGRALRSVRLCYVSPAVCNGPLWGHPDAPETLRRLHRMADLRELAGFFRLPVPGRDGCPGVPTDYGLVDYETVTEAISPGGPVPSISLGRFAEGGRVTGEPATLPLADLAKHALIVGTPGSGKTTLAFSLLAQLWRDHKIPFLVLEPAKTEYRALLDLPGVGEDLLVFTVGGERVAPFRLNPLEVPNGVPVAEHIASLATCFAGAFSLADPLPMLLDEALREAYADRGWSEYGAGGDDPSLEPPALADLLAKATEVAARSAYRGELAGNIRAALETRLGALLRGPKGRCFGARRSIPLDLLMGCPVVLELEGLAGDEKALAMMFLLSSVRAHARATRRSGAALAHVCLVEEAHAVLGRGAGHGGEGRADPQAAAVGFFTGMLAEMRALGEGLVVADQLPTALAPEVLKLTNLKAMHRVVSLEDRQELGQAMVLDAGQTEAAAVLPPGRALVFREGWGRSRVVAGANFKDEHGVDLPPADAEVRERMLPFRSSPEAREAYLPFGGCGEVCAACDGAVRERSERWAARRLPLVRAAVAALAPASVKGAAGGPPPRTGTAPVRSNAGTVALEEYLQGLDLADGDAVGWHCALVHFEEHVLAREPLLAREKAMASRSDPPTAG